MIREKETFKLQITILNEEVTLYSKCSVNYERLTFKVTPILTMSHGKIEHFVDELAVLLENSRAECLLRLEKYRSENGIGLQGDLFDNEPESASND
jgi:hypothetical protein